MPQMVLVASRDTQEILYANAHYLKIVHEAEIIFPGISKGGIDLVDLYIFKEISFEFPVDSMLEAKNKIGPISINGAATQKLPLKDSQGKDLAMVKVDHKLISLQKILQLSSIEHRVFIFSDKLRNQLISK